MRLVADMHIAPRTVKFLDRLGHDVVRVSEVLSASAPDKQIVEFAIADSRIVLTQDLDFTSIVALSGLSVPSVVTLGLASARIEYVNSMLEAVLPQFERSLTKGALVTVQERTVRCRMLPVSG